MIKRVGQFFATIGLALVGLLSSAQAQTDFAPGWRFNPPPGLTVADTRPRHHLALQSSGVVSPVYLRQVVAYRTEQRAGTIIIDTRAHFLYLVLGEGRALRYGIGVARSGFEWAGTHRVTRKAEWPGWTPPAEMRQRQPGLPAHMKGGLDNPLGARALYLGSTLYRIHGTNEPWTIGSNVSSGCIRLTNEDVIDLYGRVKLNSKVVVL
ncbi:L,D-transpeptidase [Devosia sp. PTR5]|uniref:L,D-transpeptidase n=1 Tax=Devosia oryzisoli TaxID=2774138 RepID=A0A927IT72_9HYPH|nr:L,D-transpeptidase [Devosia oryzisoli]MBD8065582.1 L,D-transpeptidase [Devosia oryzisoli]